MTKIFLFLGDEAIDPKAKEAQLLKVMKAKYQGLGPIKCHELSVLICFIIVIVLWFMRKPLFMAGKFLIDLDLFLIFKDE